MIRTTLQLAVLAGDDPLRIERLTDDLRATLADDDALRAAGVVTAAQTGNPVPGSKGAVQDVATILLATAPFAPPVFSALADVIGSWCARDRRCTVRVSDGHRSIEITGVPSPEQRAAVERFLHDDESPTTNA